MYPIEAKVEKKVDEITKVEVKDTEIKEDSLIESKKSKMVWFHVDFPGSESRSMKTVYEYIKSEYVKSDII
jgi:hypothetical protein